MLAETVDLLVVAGFSPRSLLPGEYVPAEIGKVRLMQFVARTLLKRLTKDGGPIMIYMFKVYTLVALSVFGLAGAFTLALVALNEAKQYAVARHAMRRIARGVSRESFVISRTTSRNHSGDSSRAA
jgi:hypothetical protein